MKSKFKQNKVLIKLQTNFQLQSLMNEYFQIIIKIEFSRPRMMKKSLISIKLLVLLGTQVIFPSQAQSSIQQSQEDYNEENAMTSASAEDPLQDEVLIDQSPQATEGIDQSVEEEKAQNSVGACASAKMSQNEYQKGETKSENQELTAEEEPLCINEQGEEEEAKPVSFSDKYKLSVAPPDIQTYDAQGLARAERIKEIIEVELTDLESWRPSFTENLNRLFNVTPFYNSTEGYFEQEFRGEWSASSVSFDMDEVVAQHELVESTEEDTTASNAGSIEKFLKEVQTEAKEIYEGAKNFAKNAVRYQDGDLDGVDPIIIHEDFEAAYGWSQMRYEIQLYDIDIERLKEMSGMQSSVIPNTSTVQKESFTDRVHKPKYYQEADGTIKELIYVQDLLKKTEIVNSNTLLAELNISVKLFEQNYIDHSTHVQYKTLFGSKLSENFNINAELAQLAFMRQDLSIINEKNAEAVSSRPCQLTGHLNFHVADTEESKEPVFQLPSVMSEWAQQFKDDYNEDSAYFIDGIGTDQEVSEKQRLYFVNIAIMNSADGENGGIQCFPEQVSGLYMNKRKNEWMSRFMGYGIMYLLLAGLSIVTSAFQFREVKKNQLQGPAAEKKISPIPLIILTSWTFQSLAFHIIISCTMLFVDIASQILPVMALLGVLIAFYAITYKAAVVQQKEIRQSDLIVYILLICFALIVFSPRYMTKTLDTILLFGFLWVPHIFSNLFTHPSWQFHYNSWFTLVQSIYYIFPPLYARGFHNNFYFLKPDPMPVQALICLYALQLFIMILMKHNLFCCSSDARSHLKRIHRSRCCRMCLTSACRRSLKRYLLAKLKRQHEWGWRLALTKINTLKLQETLARRDKAREQQRKGNTANRDQTTAAPTSRQLVQRANRHSAPMTQRRNNRSLEVPRASLTSTRPQRSSNHLEIAPISDLLGDPLQTEQFEYPESISHLKYQFYLYFRSFRSSSTEQPKQKNSQPKTTAKTNQSPNGGRNSDPFGPAEELKVNSFKDGMQYMSENCGTVDSPKAEQIDCSICTCCLKYRPNQVVDGVPLQQRQRCSGYYETPCLHVYHRECLLEWLRVKLECPQCRMPLPKPQEYDGAAVSLFSDDDDDYYSDENDSNVRENIRLAKAGNGSSGAQQQRQAEYVDNREPIAVNDIELAASAAYPVISDYEQQRSFENLPIPFQNMVTEPREQEEYRAAVTEEAQRADDRPRYSMMALSRPADREVEYRDLQRVDSLNQTMTEIEAQHRPRHLE